MDGADHEEDDRIADRAERECRIDVDDRVLLEKDGRERNEDGGNHEKELPAPSAERF